MTPLSYVELSRGALVHNLRAFRAVMPRGELACVVKANAYGHGMAEIARLLDETGLVRAYQVDDVDEMDALRQALLDPQVLVYGYIPLSQLAEAARWGTEVVVYDLDQIRELGRMRRPDVRFSVKIDALLGRQGVLPDDVERLIEEMDRFPGLEPVSAYAHYANIEDTTDLNHAEAQEEAFERAFARLRMRYPNLGRHIAATSGLLARPDERNTRVRLGIGLYGLYPSASLARSHVHLDLRPVMRWVTHLAQVKTLPKGHPVGYGLTYRTARETRVGIVPQGYSDGYDRGLSNVGEVLVHGRRCPVIGRVAMNMFAVDLTPAPDARTEDEVVLLGAQGEDRIAAEEIAAKLGTINYEVVARVSPLLPRVVV